MAAAIWHPRRRHAAKGIELGTHKITGYPKTSMQPKNKQKPEENNLDPHNHSHTCSGAVIFPPTGDIRGKMEGLRRARRNKWICLDPTPPFPSRTHITATHAPTSTDTRRPSRSSYGKREASEGTHQTNKGGSGNINASTPPRQPYPSLPLQLTPQISQQLSITLPALLDTSCSLQYPIPPSRIPTSTTQCALQQATTPLPLLLTLPPIFPTQATRPPPETHHLQVPQVRCPYYVELRDQARRV
jgi:hypothetical protein